MGGAFYLVRPTGASAASAMAMLKLPSSINWRPRFHSCSAPGILATGIATPPLQHCPFEIARLELPRPISVLARSLNSSPAALGQSSPFEAVAATGEAWGTTALHHHHLPQERSTCYFRTSVLHTAPSRPVIVSIDPATIWNLSRSWRHVLAHRRSS